METGNFERERIRPYLTRLVTETLWEKIWTLEVSEVLQNETWDTVKRNETQFKFKVKFIWKKDRNLKYKVQKKLVELISITN